MREVTITSRLDKADIREFLGAIQTCMKEDDGATTFHAKRFKKILVRDIQQRSGQLEMSDPMRCLRAYLAALLTLKSLILRIEQNKKVTIAPTKRATRDMTSMVYANEAIMLGLIQMRRYRGRTFNRLVNCAVITVAMCHRLGVDRVAAAETALGAVLHDLDWTGDRNRKATVHQLVRIYRGERVGRLRVTVASDVDQVDGLAPSRIIAVASEYEKLTTVGENEGDGSVLPDEALRRIEGNSRFDKMAVKLLVSTLGVYPVGTTVQLDDGCIAIVVELPDDGRSLADPIVKVVRDKAGGPSDGRLEDLSKSGAPHVARTIEPEPLELNVTHFFLA
jgi:HD-GYP domain-containing protein (c-di-GMP phosphodiesterase class II)